MTLRNASPKKFSPAGLSDSLDATDEFPGACASLQNLIPDPTTRNVWTCRPAATELTTFGSFNTPGFISCLKVVGNRAYGLIASARNSGKDEPFSFNLINNTFDTVANVLSTNVPTSPATTGDWVPPTMDLMGVLLVVTHPGFDGVTNFFGWFDISDPTSPRWHAGNLLQNGSVTLLGAITPGAGGTPGTYTNVALAGGTGTGLVVDVVIGGGGTVTSVFMDAWGSGYTVGDTPSAAVGGNNTWHVAVSAVATTVAGRLQFTTVPAWIRQFNQRCYFGINPVTAQPSVLFTDVLTFGCSNANQALTFGDNLPLTAAAPLGLSNQLGGIIQALIVFKDDENITQVTGDAASSNLAINNLNVAVGTTSPSSIVNTPYGLVFLAPDGFRLIDYDARVNDPIGAEGKGVVIPFINGLYLTRITAACSGQVVRVSVQNGAVSGQPWQEYWYDTVRKVWSGPHTFAASCIDVYTNYFIMAPQSVVASLWASTTVPNANSTYTENNIALAWGFQTVVLEDYGEECDYELAELVVKCSVPQVLNTFNVTVVDENGSTLNTVSRSVPSVGAAALWGTGQWGAMVWGVGMSPGITPFRIDFSSPVVFNRMALQISGLSMANQRLGDIYLRQRALGYKSDPINGPG